MTTVVFQVDSFTDRPFCGNPAGVCLLGKEPAEDWMRGVAAEMNVSETAFLWPEGKGFRVRYFTPLIEIPLCGHATLGSAHVLWEEGLISRKEPIYVETKGGSLAARREGKLICLDFPAIPASECPIPEDAAAALRAKPVSASCIAREGLLVELSSEEEVRDLSPDLFRLGQCGLGGTIVTAPAAGDEYDFVSRFFAPEWGIPEDPVTGAAHCSLGPYWAERFGKTELVGRQLSRRGGTVRVRVRGDRVDLLGKAVTVMKASFLVDPWEP
jgi:PhzF family phenazine biosynthesis protein